MDQLRVRVLRAVWPRRHRGLLLVAKLGRRVPEVRLLLRADQLVDGRPRRLALEPAGAVVGPRVGAVVRLARDVEPQFLEGLAIIGGILLGMGRLSQLRAVRMACGAFVEFFRAVPVLMMMLFAYYLFLFGFQISGEALPLFGVVAGLTFYNSSVIAELIRSGVGSLPKGQQEAGLAIGLTPFATLRLVLLPQAITLMLPSIVSQLVVVLKDSALGFLILYPELVRSGQTLASLQGNLIPTFIVIAAIFIIINYLLTRLAHYLERRLQARRRGPKQPELETVMSPTLPGGALEVSGQT